MDEKPSPATDRPDVARLSPDKLVAGFAHGRIWAGIGISVAIHVAVVAVTSVGYLHGVIDPEWKRERDARREAEEKAKAEARLRAAQGAASAAPSVDGGKPEGEAGAAGTDSGAGAAGTGEASSEDRMLKERADTPVVKAITGAAKPEEIPAEPDLDLSIEDTNPE